MARPETQLISVVIPVLNEEQRIRAVVRHAWEVGDEVLVVDGGSTDRTVAEARAAGAEVVHAATGRGVQLAAGVTRARGDILLFLHADAELAGGAREAIVRALADREVVGGNFRLMFVPESRAARLFGWANHIRRVWCSVYYGDSAIFVRAEHLRAIGGIRLLPLFEDYDLAQRLERSGRTRYLAEVPVRVSARRFVARPLFTLLGWVGLQVLYSCGVPAATLARWYRVAR